MYFLTFLNIEMAQVVQIFSRESKIPLIVHDWIHSFWCPVDAKSLGIVDHGIDIVIQKYFQR